MKLVSSLIVYSKDNVPIVSLTELWKYNTKSLSTLLMNLSSCYSWTEPERMTNKPPSTFIAHPTDQRGRSDNQREFREELLKKVEVVQHLVRIPLGPFI